jgi:hypothetical protein
MSGELDWLGGRIGIHAVVNDRTGNKSTDQRRAGDIERRGKHSLVWIALPRAGSVRSLEKRHAVIDAAPSLGEQKVVKTVLLVDCSTEV